MAGDSRVAAFAVIALCGTPTDALRLPLQSIRQQISATVFRGVTPVPAPFAIAEAGLSDVFSGPAASAQLTCVWDAAVVKEAQIRDLVNLAIQSSAFRELRVISLMTSNRVQLVIHGARRSCNAFLELAALQNLAVADATFS